MLTQTIAFFLLLGSLPVAQAQTHAQETVRESLLRDSIRVGGQVKQPLHLSRNELASRPKTEVKTKDRQGVEHTYIGIPLIDLLREAGAPTGMELKGENLTQFVLIQASDGYEVVFALPELDPDFATQIILLAYQVDGKPLPSGEGPFRVVVPQERKSARWIREVTTIKVLYAKE